MPEIETAGYKGWWPLRLYQGKNQEGQKKGNEIFRNMLTGEIFDPGEKGWDGEPPYPTGAPVGVKASDLYRVNYELVKWEEVD